MADKGDILLKNIQQLVGTREELENTNIEGYIEDAIQFLSHSIDSIYKELITCLPYRNNGIRRDVLEKFKLELNWSDLGSSYIYQSDEISVYFVNPHSGNDYKYLVRADFNEDHDRWVNAYYEEFFDTWKEANDMMIKDLKEMLDNKDNIIKELLKDY